jgi:hypothetical protein
VLFCGEASSALLTNIFRLNDLPSATFCTLQGNVDPMVLFCGEAGIKRSSVCLVPNWEIAEHC